MLDHAEYTAPTRQHELKIIQITQISSLSSLKYVGHQAGTDHTDNQSEA